MLEAFPCSSTSLVVISARAFLGGTITVIRLVPSLDICYQNLPLGVHQHLDESFNSELFDSDLTLIQLLLALPIHFYIFKNI